MGNTVGSVALLFLVPYQAAFVSDTETNPKFGSMDAACYIVDSFILVHRIYRFDTAWSLHQRVAESCKELFAVSSRKLRGRKPSISGEDADDESHPPVNTHSTRRERPENRARRKKREAVVLKSRRRRREEALERVSQAAMLLLSLPFDAALWGSSIAWCIPYVRFIRLLIAPVQVHNFIAVLERSQGISFAVCRVLRIVGFFILMSHCKQGQRRTLE